MDPSEAVRILRAEGEDQSEFIERFAGVGEAEHDIIEELNDLRPLASPDGFDAAHRRALYSIEVLDRNGARAASLPRLGPLGPIAQVLVSLVTRWIVRAFQNRLVSDLANLYARREAIAPRGTREYNLLRQARLHTALVVPGYRTNPIGVPAFLLGGAVVSTAVASVRGFITSLFNIPHGGLVLSGLALVLLTVVAWVLLFSAGVARRRIRLTTDDCIKNLYETIGHCGDPPHDQSLALAVSAVLLSILAWLAVPLFTLFLFGRVS